MGGWGKLRFLKSWGGALQYGSVSVQRLRVGGTHAKVFFQGARRGQSVV